MDIWTKEKRSEVMSKIKGKDTKPEMILRSLLFKLGFRYRVHKKDLPGKPDIVFVKQKIAIFVHGCFWHYHQDCHEGRIPSTNSNFWKNKLEKNIIRDENNIKTLQSIGWKVLVVWECEIEREINKTVEKIVTELGTDSLKPSN